MDISVTLARRIGDPESAATTRPRIAAVPVGSARGTPSLDGIRCGVGGRGGGGPGGRLVRLGGGGWGWWRKLRHERRQGYETGRHKAHGTSSGFRTSTNVRRFDTGTGRLFMGVTRILLDRPKRSDIRSSN